MRKFYIPVFLVVFCFMAFAAKSISAQMVGGYNPARTNDPQVKAAARYAVATQSKRAGRIITLHSVSKAQQQVVAGMNYKMCLKVRDRKRTRWAMAVVYRHWKGNRELTSWDWGCNW